MRAVGAALFIAAVAIAVAALAGSTIAGLFEGLTW